MIQVQYTAIIASVLLVFVLSTIYYIVLNKPYKKLLGAKTDENGSYKISVTPNRIIVELVRNFVMALVIAYAIAILELATLEAALLLAFWLWIGFPLVLLVGLMTHENYSKGLAAIHAGDWLLKLVLLAAVLTLWP